MEIYVPDIAVSQVDRLKPEIHPMCINEYPFYLLHFGDVKGQKRLRACLECPVVGAGSAVAELHVDVLGGRVESRLIQ